MHDNVFDSNFQNMFLQLSSNLVAYFADIVHL